MQVGFDPGGGDAWSVRTAGDRVLALGPTEADRAAALVEVLGRERGFEGVLDELLRAGISTAPAFALVEFADGVARVVLRGPVRAVVGEEELDGTGVTTWLERSASADAVRLEVPGGSWRFAADGAAVTAASPVAAVAAAGTAAPETEPVPEVDEPAPVEESSIEVSESTIAPEEEPVPRHEFLFAPPPGFGFEAEVDDAEATETGDHDGETVLVGDLPRSVDHDGLTILQGDLPARGGDHDGMTVLADEVAGLATGVTPPAFAATESELSLELPDGRREPLGQPVLLGRSPNLARSTGPLPRLLTVGADDPDISRTHARVSVEGGTVLVTDLGSRNGTSVVLPGRAPQRLREGEPTAVLVGTVIDLGGGVTLTVRED